MSVVAANDPTIEEMAKAASSPMENVYVKGSYAHGVWCTYYKHHHQELQEVVNEYGFPQHVNQHGERVCPECLTSTSINTGQGVNCDRCSDIEAMLDYADGEIC